MSHVLTAHSPNIKEVIHDAQKQHSFRMKARAKNGKITIGDSQPPCLPFVREERHLHSLDFQTGTQRPNLGHHGHMPHSTLPPPQ